MANSENELRVEISRPLLWSPPPQLDPITPISYIEDTPDRDTSYFAYLRGMATPRQYSSSTRIHQIAQKVYIPLLLLTVLLLWPYGFHSFHNLQTLTDTTYKALPGSPSQLAQEAFQQNYNSSDWSNPLRPPIIVALSSTQSLVKSSSPAYHQARNWTLSLEQTLQQNNFTTWVNTVSYYSLVDRELQWMANALASEDDKTVLAEVRYLGGFSDHKQRMDHLLEHLRSFTDQHSQKSFNVSFTGIPLFQRDLSESTRQDLKRMDTFVLPIALVVVGVVLNGSVWFTWMVPLFTMISTVSLWSILMCIVARHWQITHFTPSIMMSLTLGMGIDYTIFLLCRYLEPNGRDVGRMLEDGGHVLVWSGLTLIVCFLGLLMLPLPMLQSVGIGAAITIASAMISNLVLVPALLCTPLGRWIAKSPEYVAETPRNYRFPGDTVIVRSSLWHRIARLLLHPYRGAILLLILLQLLFPVAQYAMSFKSSIRFETLIPWNSKSLETYHLLEDKAGPGKLHPYRILFDGHRPNISMTSKFGFDIMHLVVDELIGIDHHELDSSGMTHIATSKSEEQELVAKIGDEMQHVDWLMKENPGCEDLIAREKPSATSFTGIAVMHNARIPYPVYWTSRLCDSFNYTCPLELFRVLHEIDRAVTNADEYATFVTATLTVDPFSDEGLKWLEDARASIVRLEEAGVLFGVKVHIDGTAAIETDTVNAVYASFPRMILTTVTAVFALMGIFFRSIYQPLRSVISIGLTLSFAFGLSVLVFERGIFDALKVHSLSSENKSICWLVPLMAFSIMIGLALDYDVFLMSRVLQYRLDGYDHKSSIAAGLNATGGIITAAGLIMAFAFGSLIFSSNPVLCQWSFLITVGVLLDTFVIRSFIVPVTTSLFGDSCWWPRRLPDALIGYDDLIIQSSDSLVDLGMTPGIPEENLGESEYEPLRSPDI